MKKTFQRTTTLLYTWLLCATALTAQIPISSPVLFASDAVLGEGGEGTVYRLSSNYDGQVIEILITASDNPNIGYPLPYSGLNWIVTPFKNHDPRNGITTYDLLLIQQHILGLEPDANPYRLIAADVNRDGIISISDVLDLRLLILGIYNEFPSGSCYRFVREGYQFEDPQRPTLTPFPEYYKFINVTDAVYAKFIAIQLGDITAAYPDYVQDSLQGADDRSPIALRIADMDLQAGHVYDVPVYMPNRPLLGLQGALEATESITFEVANTDFEDQYTTSKQVMWAWTNPRGEVLDVETPWRTLRVRANTSCRLSDALSLRTTGHLSPEAYTKDERKHPLELQWDNQQTAGWAIGTPQPNPTTADATISITAPAATAATMRLYDAAGRLVQEQNLALQKGYNSITWPASVMTNTGLYNWQLVTADGSIRYNGKLVRM
jgi:hypothetical protein